MLELPALMYKDKGDQQRAGGTYSYKLISTPEEWADASAQGWHATLPDAINLAGQVNESAAEEMPSVDAPPTRAELEEKAAELGLRFHPNIGDLALADRIMMAIAKNDIVSALEN